VPVRQRAPPSTGGVPPPQPFSILRSQSVLEGNEQALAEFTHGLAEATNVDDVVRTVAESGRAILHATDCRLALWDRDRDVLVVPSAVVGAPYDENRGGFRDTVPVGGCTATAPLRNAMGEVFAVLDVHWPAGALPGAARGASLGAMLDVCARSLQRAIVHDAQDALIRALRHELLPPLPAVTGLELSARYLPADDQLAFGGDWYDAIPLGPTTTALVIGDVVGHGVHAAARMARVRGVLNALIQLDPDPGSVFRRAFHLLASLQDPFTGTAAVFVIDTATDVLTFASAGHPPALARTPGGDLTCLTRGHGPALGLPARTISPGRVPFGAGSTLLAYTDGLVERRGHDMDAGIQTIAALLDDALFAAAPSAAQVLDRVLRGAGVLAHSRDDVTAVLIRRT
jgi:serine phosphatase RsbU (regulator of sigma subunit)